MQAIAATIGAGWLAFWVIWFAAAARAKRSRASSSSDIGIAIFIGRNWGVPMTERVDPELVTTGPYRYVRHPIYSGVILALIGTALALGLYWLVIAAAVAAYFGYSATIEERNLEREFPSTYPAYKRSTKMLIPFIL